MIIDGNVQNLANEKKLRVGFSQVLCLEKIYKEGADKEINLLMQSVSVMIVQNLFKRRVGLIKTIITFFFSSKDG